MRSKKGQKGVESTDLQQELVAHTPEVVEPKIIYEDEKIELTIQDVLRIRPQDLTAFKHDFEAFITRWDN
jgi:hypothetical protein